MEAEEAAGPLLCGCGIAVAISYTIRLGQSMGQRGGRCQQVRRHARRGPARRGRRSDWRPGHGPIARRNARRAEDPAAGWPTRSTTRCSAQLMSLRIVPDSRVTIDALARELGVSQTPIRDALNRMEADGLVVRVPHAGYRIPPQITRQRFEDMLEIRLLLEPAAARRAAESASVGAGGRAATNAGGDGGAGGGRRARGLRRVRAPRRRLPRSRRPERPATRSSARRWPGCTPTCTCSGSSTTSRSPTWPWGSTTRSSPRSPRATRTPPPTPCVGTSCCPATGSVDCSTRSRARTTGREGLDARAVAG